MIETFEDGSVDDAIAGETVAYVPCFDAPATFSDDDDDQAVVGADEGYVALDEAGTDADDTDDDEAIDGRSVGFVAGPCENCVVFDDLDRVVASGWDTSSTGLTYTYLGDPSVWSVDGDEGVLTWQFGQPNVIATEDGRPWTLGEWTFHTKFLTGIWDYSGSDGYAQIIYTNGQRSIYIAVGSNTGSSDPHGYIENDGPLPRHAAFDFQPATWYHLKWHYELATGLSELKVWADGDTEPDWILSTVESGDYPGTEFRIHAVSIGAGWFGTYYVQRWEYLEFCDVSA